MELELNGVARLSHLGVIRVTGDEAAAFLNGQLTNDFALLTSQQARLAAYCTAKGRMLASFVTWKRAPAEILLVCSRDLLAATLKRLSMYVLRAKATLSDASDEYALYGIGGAALAQLAPGVHAPWTRITLGDADLVQLYAADGRARALWLGSAATQPAGEPLEIAHWLLGEVRSGVATLSAPVSEAFVPQMLNYESVGGVNFKKGCYPGQEVVARSQFRGALKRRAYLVQAEALLFPGQEVFQANDPEQPVGQVVQAAALPAGGCNAIVSMQVAAAAAGGLAAGAVDGAALSLLPLPYVLLDDI